jgi:PBSX family phage terminase large subunit
VAVIDLNYCFPVGADGKRSPLPKQKSFMDSVLDPKGPAYCLYSGGMGSGKTLIGCITTLILAVLYPGDYLVCRLFNPELRLTTYKTLLELCPKELIVEHRVADQILKIKSQNGKSSNIIFRGLEDPEKHKSLNLNAAYIDEASQVPEAAFTLLQSRLRGPHVRKLLMTTNPEGHSFLKRYFVRKDWKDESIKKDFFHVSAPSIENTHLPSGYVQRLMKTWSKERVERDLNGNWDSFSGQIYTELSRNVHLIKPFPIPKEWTRFLSADHGYRNPACFGWWAVDYDGNLYLRKSFYKSGWIIEEICKGNKTTGEPGIISINGEEKHEGIYIDPSIRANRGKDSDWQTYLDHLPSDWGLYLANNEVEDGINRVKQYLKVDEKTGKPRVFIFDVPENEIVVEELFQYRWDELTPGQEMNKNAKETPTKKDDHGCDMFRYGIMSRVDGPSVKDATDSKRNEYGLSGSLQRELHDIRGGDKSKKDPFGEEYGPDPGIHNDF